MDANERSGEVRHAKEERTGGEGPARELTVTSGTNRALSKANGQEVPDVRLDVPTAIVEKLALEVDRLESQVALNAQLAKLVQLEVGAKVRLEDVTLRMRGVDVRAMLEVRLHHVQSIFERALRTLDTQPDVLHETNGEEAPTVGTSVAEGGADRFMSLMRKTRRKLTKSVRRTVTAPPRKALTKAREDASELSQRVAGAARGMWRKSTRVAGNEPRA